MKSFDEALKYLAQHHPRDFIRFALGDPNIDIIKPLPTGLPARRRDIDGCYLITPPVSFGGSSGDEPCVAHLEFHRRKQSLDELAIDITEAQLRLFRREGKRVHSLVWDLYGKRDEPFLETRIIAFGVEIRKQCSQGVYLRVNLRAIGWRELLRRAPPVLWPLIALTRDGDREEAIVEAANAIKANKDLGFSERTDYLTILRFVAEAEHVPSQLLETLLEEEFIMASDFYQSVINKGVAKGVAQGVALGIVKGKAEGAKEELASTIIRALRRRLGSVNADVQERMMTETSLDTLREWHDMATDAADAKSAQRLVDTIRKTQST